ncbi:endonuclease/exonuclease/phosphatase family protein [Parafrankia sp. EUN1f]|uniref:endonuclease/exonuclease/phosphatase family protein n=1 Tax=Parafrankia sp. EUN1f TaxID=102897 RepID=UPI0001C45562|nr:endonuclease/exonuclease/phosphatase family protein [Parafrankia sp. EUN1f]EFC86441.1 Endonuclease/exonuclease/phosphatase [Parafrankia sp. EUN1f]
MAKLSARRLITAASLPAMVAATLTALPTPATALSADVVISAVYGGGGNSGATIKNDFIELANLTASPISVEGWSVQYASAAGAVFQLTALHGSIPAGGRYLVQEAAGAAGTLSLPTPDATGSVPMSATSGVVALVTNTIPLVGCGISCAVAPNVKDLVGYGATANVETLAAPGLTNTTAGARSGSLVDTDNNSVDFTSGVPKATNSAGTTVTATDDPGGGPTGPTPGSTRIHDIQGSGRISPIVGQSVTNVPGIVTAVRTTGSSRGYWLQDPTADADPLTSEGIFVFTGSTSPAVAIGDSVLTTGRVTEYRPAAGAQSLTELGGPIATSKLSSGNALPAPTPVSFPDTFTKTGSLEAQPLEPSSYVLDWLEVHEGMRVTVAQDTRLISPVNTEFGELWVTLKPTQNQTPRGGSAYVSYDDPNSGRLMLQALDGAPAANVGSTLAAGSVGVVDYQSFGGYVIQTTTLGTITDGGLKRQKVTPPKKTGDLSIATYNVENLTAGDSDAKFARLAEAVVVNLGKPDILALEEIQDNNGTVDDGVVAADQTVARFIAAIVAAGGPTYDWRSINPNDGTDGGAPGGNIRQVFLFNPARTTFVDRPGGDANTAVSVLKVRPTSNQVYLSASPGRINPTSSAWSTSRKPLVGEFLYDGDKQLFVVANHFNSKGGDYPLSAAVQPPVRSSEAQRTSQATEVRNFVADLAAKSGNAARVVVLGDINDYQFSPTLATLTDNGALLKPLINDLPVNERYSYVFDGNSQTLDHILISPTIKGYSYGVVHVNAEFSDQASDHDPQIIRILTGCGSEPLPDRCRPGSPVVDVP